MHDSLVWWQRPRLVAALVCVVLGVAMLIGGPALRGAMTPTDAPPAGDLDVALIDDSFAEPTVTLVTESPVSTELIIYVSGAVVSPDVYRLPEGARVLDAVFAAGGFRDDAVGAEVNLAAPLSDAQHIHIPGADEPVTAAVAEAAAGSAVTGGLIDLNQASAVDLEELPGIGKALAARIITYREQQGPFSSVEDLQNVTGIGEALFGKISPLVSVGT